MRALWAASRPPNARDRRASTRGDDAPAAPEPPAMPAGQGGLRPHAPSSAAAAASTALPPSLIDPSMFMPIMTVGPRAKPWHPRGYETAAQRLAACLPRQRGTRQPDALSDVLIKHFGPNHMIPRAVLEVADVEFSEDGLVRLMVRDAFDGAPYCTEVTRADHRAHNEGWGNHHHLGEPFVARRGKPRQGPADGADGGVDAARKPFPSPCPAVLWPAAPAARAHA